MPQKPLVRKPTGSSESRLEQYLAWHAHLSREHQIAADYAKSCRDKLDAIEQDYLPNLLRELGVAEVTATDGTTVKMAEQYTASVSARNHEQAANILQRIGADEAVRNKVTLDFGPADTEQMHGILAELSERDITYEQKAEINAQTLKAVVRRALGEGKLTLEDLPSLGVWATSRAQIKLPKQ